MLIKLRSLLKKILHKHKYVILDLYPPRPKYYSTKWRFLIRCECGHSKPTKLPRTIEKVFEVRSVIEYNNRTHKDAANGAPHL